MELVTIGDTHIIAILRFRSGALSLSLDGGIMSVSLDGTFPLKWDCLSRIEVGLIVLFLYYLQVYPVAQLNFPFKL